MPKFFIRLDHLAEHVDIQPGGGEIVLEGSFESSADGSIVDAKTTTWPAEAPGGPSVDSGGLIDFEGGGFHVTSRDPVTHVVHARPTGDSGAACAAFGVASPCLPLRVRRQAQSRLLTDSQWLESLKGGIEVEVIAPSVYAPAEKAAESAAPWLGVGAALLAVAAVGFFGWKIRTKRAASPTGQLLTLAARVREKLKRADAVVAAPLAPAIDAALRALRERRVDASSTEGKRVMAVLVRVDARLDASVAEARAEEEQQAADELVREVESALEAVDEANALGPRRRATRAEP